MVSRSRAAQALFGLAVAGALAFGATEARASARNDCTINYQSGQIGACQSHSHCEAGCMWFYPENGGVGTCFQGCCTCAI